MVTLEASRISCQLSQTEMEALRALARERTYSGRQEIFREGDQGDGVYIVKDGAVEISALIGPGLRGIFSKIMPGDMFGELAVIDDQPRSATATALERTTVYFLPRKEFLEFAHHSPAMSRCLLREVCRRLREFDRQYLREVLQAEGLALIGRFAGSIVHDLKNPMNLIGLAAETACMSRSTVEVRHRAKKIIRQQIATIKELVDEILTVSQGSPRDVRLIPINYGEFANEMIEEVRSAAAVRSANLQLQGALPLVLVHMNPHRLRRVFLNLFHNAAASMPEGGDILIRFRLTEAEVVTEIEDTGPGIAPEILGQLFSAFATHGRILGTGLGLFICKRIVEDHKGWISARNEPGRGAIFSFGLPLAKGAPGNGKE